RNLIADECLDRHHPAALIPRRTLLQLGDQPLGALGERIDIPDGPVDPPEVTVHEKDAQPHGHDEQREHADQVVANERLAVLPSEPMPAADEHDAAVEPDGDHEAEKDEAAKADYA